MSINSKIINSKVGFFDNLYTVAIGNHQVLYNPYSYKGKLVINRSIYLILKDLLSSKRTYKVILDLASKKLPQLKKNDVEAMINGLDSYDLLSFNNEKNFFHYNPDVSNKLLVFWIDITNQCNFECTYCFVNKKKEIIDPVKLEELLERLGELRNKYCFTKLKFVLSGGEPLLYFKTLQKVVEAIDNFQKKNINTISIEKSLITNGTLLTDEKALYLKKNNISANISLDGLGQFNNMTRKFIGSKKDTFPYIMKGVKIAQKHNASARLN